ncbi:hypothetical protein LJB42_000808 [Komagataella kurtzmanii]|nr:hypothetical protein LJB42_000808 [Komagataella kurtzmanii]
MPEKLEEWEIKKYWEIFSGLKPVDNKLSGDRVSVVFKNSQLNTDQLALIWDLSDIDQDGELDFEEFCIAMRLIFDLVNGTIAELPSTLPNWLVPGSKAHLVQANSAVSQGSNYSANTQVDDDDEDAKLSSDFEWYISPADKSSYESIYTASSDQYGRIKFNDLQELYETLVKVPQTDISSAWNLVNPKQAETIDKDQCLVFLHILNQRSNGKRVPRGVPASLRATFSKESPTYDLKSSQAQVTKPSSAPGHESRKHSFADSYLSKIGASQNSSAEVGTDFSATKDTDWEEVRLTRQLQDLEELISKVEKDRSQRLDPDPAVNASSMTKYELEQLLKYKEDKLTSLKLSNGVSSGSLPSIKADVDLIESQVQTLQEYLQSKKEELKQLQSTLKT